MPDMVRETCIFCMWKLISFTHLLYVKVWQHKNIWQKTTEFYKAITFQLKINKFKKSFDVTYKREKLKTTDIVNGFKVGASGSMIFLIW